MTNWKQAKRKTEQWYIGERNLERKLMDVEFLYPMRMEEKKRKNAKVLNSNMEKTYMNPIVISSILKYFGGKNLL